MAKWLSSFILLPDMDQKEKNIKQRKIHIEIQLVSKSDVDKQYKNYSLTFKVIDTDSFKISVLQC